MDLTSVVADENNGNPQPITTLEDLAKRKLWVAWQSEARKGGGKPTKVPVNARKGGPASSTNSDTWAPRANAETTASLLRGDPKGIGIMLAPIDEHRHLGGIDLDACVDGEGNVEAWAREIVELVGSYTEVSPNGHGLKIFFIHDATETLAYGRRWRSNVRRPGKPAGEKEPGIEFYLHERYFTVTGRLFEIYDTIKRVGVDRLRQVQEKMLAFGGKAEKQPAKPEAGDDDLRQQRILDAIGHMPNADAHWNDWNRIGMAIFAATKGSERGRVAFHGWSAKSGKYDAAACEERWEHWHVSPPDQLTAGTIFFEARDEGAPAGSEDALALELIEKHGRELRYVAELGKWFRWDGHHWAEDKTVAIYDLARPIARHWAGVVKGGRKIASAAAVAGVERLARSDRRVALTADQFDVDPAILNTPGGIVDLRTGALTPNDPAALCSQITAVSPADDESCPGWKQAISLYMNNDSELVAFLQRFAGYCLWGAVVDQVIVFACGKGGNGKGTLFNALARIMGSYAKSAPAEVFLSSPFDHHSTELARLRNARLVISSEIERGRRWNMPRLNQLSGGDTVTARFMRQDDFEYLPKFKLAIFANNRPSFGKVDEATRRRLRLLTFGHTVTDRDRAANPGFDAQIRGEWPGVLRWMINGCLDWQREGLNAPQAVLDDSSDYLANQNNIAAWIADSCVEDVAATTALKDLFESWTAWCDANGERPGSSRGLADLLVEQGFPRTRKHGGTRAHAGIRLAIA